MSYELFIAFFSASSFITFLPGPTVLLIVHYALQYGKWSGRYSIPATILGDIAALTLAFAGLGTILNLFPEWFSILKIAGGIYMIILGILGLFSNSTVAQENAAEAKPPGRTVFMHVFLSTAHYFGHGKAILKPPEQHLAAQSPRQGSGLSDLINSFFEAHPFERGKSSSSFAQRP